MEKYKKDLLKVIKSKIRATESNIMQRLEPKYQVYAGLYFNDAIDALIFEGKIIRMYRGGVTWWETV